MTGLSIQALPIPVCLLCDGAVVQHNEAFARWVDQSAPIGRTLAELFPGDAAMERLRDEALALGASAEHHFARQTASGAPSFWSVRAQRVDEGVLLFAVDVGSFVHAAQAVHAAQRDYVAVAAHELRGPLAAIKAWASAASAKRGADGGEPFLGEALQIINRQVDRMSDLIADLLGVARTDAGAIRAARGAFEVDLLVRHVVGASPYGARATVAGTLPGRALVDPLHLEAVMGKLLTYVARRQLDGPIAIDAHLAPGEIHVTVVDRGPPLPARAWDEVFARFSRNSRKKDGGLGLYLCQQLMAVNGGRIWLEAFEDAHRFVIALPEAPPGAEDDAALAEVMAEASKNGAQALADVPPSSMSAPSSKAGAPLRILLGERDPELLARTISVLRLQGYEVGGVTTAGRFFAELDAGAFDVVLIDLALPGLDLAEDVRRIRTRGPIVLASTPTPERPQSLAWLEREGVQAVLPKPFDWTHLLAMIRSATANRT